MRGEDIAAGIEMSAWNKRRRNVVQPDAEPILGSEMGVN